MAAPTPHDFECSYHLENGNIPTIVAGHIRADVLTTRTRRGEHRSSACSVAGSNSVFKFQIISITGTRPVKSAIAVLFTALRRRDGQWPPLRPPDFECSYHLENGNIPTTVAGHIRADALTTRTHRGEHRSSVCSAHGLFGLAPQKYFLCLSQTGVIGNCRLLFLSWFT